MTPDDPEAVFDGERITQWRQDLGATIVIKSNVFFESEAGI